MTLFIFKYALPALLGYTLFVGIAGKFNPFSKPDYLEERPSWMLGLWTGTSIFAVLSIGLHMAYSMTIDAARALIVPSAIGISLLLGLGFITYLRYRSQVFATMDENELEAEYDDDSKIHWSEKIYQLDSIIGNSIPEVTLLSDSSDVARLKIELEKERELRQETEIHLRITRKALSTMNQEEPRDVLDITLNSSNSTESNKDDLELNVANLKRELVKAKHEIRMHVAARAKALSTANKSVAFARQSIELRARLETELETAHAALAIRQTTISSLINRLERERRLTDDELATLAKHVAVNDPKLKPDFPEQRVAGLETQQNTRFTNRS